MKYIQIVFLLIFSCSLLAETRIDYYVNLGGIKIADANFIIKSDKKNWSLETEVEAAGIVDVFVKFISTTESKGIINNNKLVPELYKFSYLTGRGNSRKGSIKYKDNIPVRLTAEPNYNDNEIPSLEFLEEYGSTSNDPYSALLVHGSYSDPCKFIAQGFDGLRSFKTIFVREAREEKIIIGGQEVMTSKCIGYFDPIVGYKESDFLDEISKPGSVRYWFKYFDSLDLWAPVKVIIDTPLGGFVLKGTALKN